jgi:leucyl aminopeptidase
MKLNIKTIPEKMPAKGLLLCIIDKDKEYFENLPTEIQLMAKKYQAKIKKNEKIPDPFIVPSADKKDDGYILFTSPSSIKYFDNGEALKTAAAKSIRKAKSLDLENIYIPVNSKSADSIIPVIAEGILLGSYHFDRYLLKKDDKKKKAINVTFFCRKEKRTELLKKIKEVENICTSVNAARDIVNEPGSAFPPAEMASHVKKMAAKYSLKCTILDEKKLAKEGYNGLLTVGGGSSNPPRLIIIEYKPKKASTKNHLCIIGKGITFDTGGISLKPPKGMWEMKSDMSGAAAAIHSIEAIAKLKLPIRVTAIIPAAENAVGAKSVLPGDIFKARNGKTVQVENTDAEGRLVLTDAFYYAGKIKATHIIDLATLTGSCVRALGTSLTGLLSDDKDFSNLFMRLSEEAGEPCWELPIYKEYRKYLECDFADINNIGNTPNAGATQAALFLLEFKPEGVPWIHLDIAGTAFADKEWKYFRSGGTGVGVRSLVSLARELA